VSRAPARRDGAVRSTAAPGERGRQPSPEHLCFLGVNLLGDCLCTTPTVRAFRRNHPDAFITYIVQNEPHCRILDGNPDIDLVIYSEALALHGPSIVDERWLERLPVDCGGLAALHRFDVHALHRSRRDVFDDHMSRGFARLLNVSIESVRPIVTIGDDERRLARSLVRSPYVVLGMHSTSPVLGRDRQMWPKDWVFDRWLRLARALSASASLDVVAVGSENDPQTPSRHFRNLFGLPIKVVAALLQEAACEVTVEAGLSHLCHAVDAPMVLIYTNDVPRNWAAPIESTRARVLYDAPIAITWNEVLRAVHLVMAMRRPDGAVR
jgi:ADP-heptose:LPS heptosyltransferase